MKTVLSIRRFLHLHPELQSDFFKMTSNFNGTLNQVRGPASALSWQLGQISWTCDNQGLLLVGAHTSISLLLSSQSRIKRFLDLAWQQDLIRLHTTRWSLRGLPDISRCATVAVLEKFPDHQRSHLLREIACCYQLESQKVFWDTSSNGLCRFCQAEDSKIHRLLHCPVGSDVRCSFRDLVDDLRASEPSLCYFPVAHVHASSEALQVVHTCHPAPVFSEALKSKVKDMVDRDVIPFWFTDGSCRHPSSPLTRFSGYSIVLDLCESHQEREAIAKQYQYFEESPPSFVVAAIARTNFEQDILRAELMAIIHTLLSFPGVVHSDSQVAICNIHFVLKCTAPAQFANLEHFDLLHHLWTHRAGVKSCVVKIKAHQDITIIQDPISRYLAMGNRFADEKACLAAKHLLPEVARELEDLHTDISLDQQQLLQVCQLHVALSQVRSKSEQSDHHTGQTAQSFSPKEISHAFATWSVPIPVPLFGAINTTWCVGSAWGEDIMYKVAAWLQNLRWPLDKQGPLGKETGISWVELGLSLTLFCGHFLPVLREDANKDKRVIYPGSRASADDLQISCYEIGNVCKQLFDHLESLTFGYELPSFTKKKVSSLYVQGAYSFSTGWDHRPEIPFQRRVAELLQFHLVSYGGRGLERVANLQFPATNDHILPDVWVIRQRRAKLSALKAARQRRQVRGV